MSLVKVKSIFKETINNLNLKKIHLASTVRFSETDILKIISNSNPQYLQNLYDLDLGLNFI